MNLMDLMIAIGVEDNASSELSKITGNAQKTVQNLEKGIANVVKVGTAAVASVTAGVGALTKLSIDNYSQYEQLAGGVETLFKSSADNIKAFSDKAYKTAGMSANQYMDTAIKSSAALIRSLNGDTAKAAEIADMAITDMADNANKMGTSLQSLQNAYTGFSRGNFTMLDNLALGFSGTKEGMEELLATAKELTGIDYNIDSYADIVQAIHAIQEEMEITGTTAREAAGTISGSVASAGAAWDNFLTGVADGNADLEQLTDNLVDSVFTVADNILPRIGQAVDGIITSFGRLLGFDLSGVAEKVSAFGNNVVTVSKNIMAAFKEGGVFGVFGEITEMIQTVVGVDLSWISEKFNVLGTAIRNVQDAFMEGGIDGGLSAFVREFAGLTGVDISGVVDGVKGFIGAIGTAAPEFIDSVGRAIDAVLEPFGKPDAQAVIDKISDSIHAFVGWIEEADFTWIVSVGEGIGKLIEPIVTAAPEVIENVKNGVRDFFGVIFGADGVSLKGIADSVVDLFSPITSAVASALTTISEKFADIMKYAKESGFGDNLRKIAGAAMDLFGSFTSGLAPIVTSVADSIGYLGTKITKKLIDDTGKLADNLSVISSVGDWLWDIFGGTAASGSDILETIVEADKLRQAYKAGDITAEEFNRMASELYSITAENIADREKNKYTGSASDKEVASVSDRFKDVNEREIIGELSGDDPTLKKSAYINPGAVEFTTGEISHRDSTNAGLASDIATGVLNGLLAMQDESYNTSGTPVVLELDGEVVAKAIIDPLTARYKLRGQPIPVSG